MKQITVFCGSNCGSDVIFFKEAYQLGKSLAELNISIVYGGTNIGLMGAVADGAIANGGSVIGVIPEFLNDKQITHKNLSETIFVKSMHERKLLLNQLSDGFVTLPGGIGTLEEFFEILSWSHLGLHSKPMAIVNTKGYYDYLFKFIEIIKNSKFVNYNLNEKLFVYSEVKDLIKELKSGTLKYK